MTWHELTDDDVEHTSVGCRCNYADHFSFSTLEGKRTVRCTTSTTSTRFHLAARLARA